MLHFLPLGWCHTTCWANVTMAMTFAHQFLYMFLSQRNSSHENLNYVNAYTEMERQSETQGT